MTSALRESPGASDVPEKCCISGPVSGQDLDRFTRVDEGDCRCHL
jgi:hypothetical protein